MTDRLIKKANLLLLLAGINLALTLVIAFLVFWR